MGRGKKDQPVMFLRAGRLLLRKQEGVPRNWGSGGNDCEHRRRQGAHRKRPPAILKVNCPKGAREGGLGHWLLSDRPESNTVSSPPRRAELVLEYK